MQENVKNWLKQSQLKYPRQVSISESVIYIFSPKDTDINEF